MPGYVHSDSHNRLTTKHATDLKLSFNNLRLTKHTQSLEQQDKAHPGWCSQRGRRGGGTPVMRIRVEHGREDAELEDCIKSIL